MERPNVFAEDWPKIDFEKISVEQAKTQLSDYLNNGGKEDSEFVRRSRKFIDLATAAAATTSTK